jgi:hypothetical protein
MALSELDSDAHSDAHSDTSARGDAQALPAPLSNPGTSHKLTNSQYDCLDDLLDDLHDHGAKAGFAVYKMRSNNYIKDFGPSRVDLGCYKGKIQPSRAHSRNTSTVKQGCTWQAIAKALLVNGERKWTFHIKSGCESHVNHEAKDFQCARRLRTEHKAFVAQYIDRPAVSNREVAVDLRNKFPGIVFTRRQLRSLRYRLRKESLNGYTPFQATKKLLDDEGIMHQIKWAAAPDDGEAERKPEGLFWTYKWCEKQWVLYPWVQLYDNTYRTNNKGLAFFQVVGLNHLGMAFACGFGLINNERQEGFDWLMDQVDVNRARIGASTPSVTITDYDDAMRNAIARVYPEAQPQICIFHINKNVALHFKKKWNKDAAAAVAQSGQQSAQQSTGQSEAPSDLDTRQDDGEEVERVVNRANRAADGSLEPLPTEVEYSMAGMYTLWEHMIYSASLDSFNAAWEMMRAYFASQTAILTYLETTYLPVVEQWAGCYINKRLNFGQRTTSPVESVNGYLKSFVINGNSTVKQVVGQAFNMVTEMERSVKEAVKEEKNRLRFEYIGQKWLGSAPYNVSSKALKLVTKQYRTMLGAVESRSRRTAEALKPCTGRFTAQYGMPCSHKLFERYQVKNLMLKKEDFHPY